MIAINLLFSYDFVKQELLTSLIFNTEFQSFLTSRSLRPLSLSLFHEYIIVINLFSVNTIKMIFNSPLNFFPSFAE